MGFEEDAVRTRGQSGAGEGGDIFTLAAADTAGAAGDLHAVSGVDNGGVPVAGHDAKATHVDDQVLIAKSRASVSLPDFLSPGLFKLVGDKSHFVG